MVISSEKDHTAQSRLPCRHHLRQLLHSVLSEQSRRPGASRNDDDIAHDLLARRQFDTLDDLFTLLALLLHQAADLTPSANDASILMRDSAQTDRDRTAGFRPAGLRVQVRRLVVEFSQAWGDVRVFGGRDDGGNGVAEGRVDVFATEFCRPGGTDLARGLAVGGGDAIGADLIRGSVRPCCSYMSWLTHVLVGRLNIGIAC